jgi:hypothetical protein
LKRHTPRYLKTKITTTTTDIIVSQDGIGLLGELDYPIAFRTSGRFVRWGVLQYFEVMFIGAVIHIHLRFKRISAQRTSFPITAVFFRKVIATQCIPAMIPEAAVTGIGKKDIIVLIITDPAAATFCFGQIALLAAQTAHRRVRNLFLLFMRYAF